MFDQPLFILGAMLWFPGGLLFMGLLFSNGGWRKSEQFRVLRELITGHAGQGARLLLVLSGLLLVSGTCLLFSGVAASDHARADRCRERCAAEGYASSDIGPNSDRTDDPSSRWVACICREGDAPDLELRANDL